jgi:hypothetical protein
MQAIERNARVWEVSFQEREEFVQVTEVQRNAFGDDVLHIASQSCSGQEHAPKA